MANAPETPPVRLPLRIHGDGGPGTMAHGEVEDVLRWATERGLDVRIITSGKAVAQIGTETTNDPKTTDLDTETGVLRALCGAVDDLETAILATKNGLLADHCEDALQEVRVAMRMAIGGDNE